MEITQDDLCQMVSACSEVVSTCSEQNIIEKASAKIDELINTHLEPKNITNETSVEINAKKNAEQESCRTVKENLQSQIRLGEITPFQAAKKEADNKKSLGIYKESNQFLDLEKYLHEQAELARKAKLLKKRKDTNANSDAVVKKRKLISNSSNCSNHDCASNPEPIILKEPSSSNTINNQSPVKNNLDDNEGPSEKKQSKDFQENSGSEYYPSDSDCDSEINKKDNRKNKSKRPKHKTFKIQRVLDDGDEALYRERVEQSDYKRKKKLHKVDKLFKVPESIWSELFKYQKVAVRWLWELHTRNLGGLLGDEMGLGKTVQVIAFLAGLDCSELLTDGGRFRGLGPTLIVCPATLIEQWVSHFHDWWPTLRCAILHHSGTFQGEVHELLDSLKVGGVLVTSYSGILIHSEILLKMKWHYIILDEGHKIRNPEAKVTKIVKKFQTPHRLLLSGSPMQNSLKELWSLFDFILPGKLGTLPAFMEHCATPITKGGYSNASRLQEATALQVATMLKDAISPYMLRRTKADVQHHVTLPGKNEQVLFCSLTDEQKSLYKQFLKTDDVSFVVHEKQGGRFRSRLLVALTALRKICNHPDLYLYGHEEQESDEDIHLDDISLAKFGHWKRSGKMTVVKSLLKIWKRQEHRVLLFTQSRQMLCILESLLQKEEHKYLRMDGTTAMSQRQFIISKFNSDSSYFVFLLTTKVGGLGVNLTGADRVIIYDPDWNPATDSQAKERAWRIGQDKNVTIYRLITAGTIEEKIYHRQIFKTLLSLRVLEDPRQRRIFQTSDLAELFHLNEPINGDACESDKLFQESKLSVSKPKFSADKIAAMRKLAQDISKKLSKNTESKEQCKNLNSANSEDGCSFSKMDNCTNAEKSHSNSLKNESLTLKHCENGPKNSVSAFKSESSINIANSASYVIDSEQNYETKSKVVAESCEDEKHGSECKEEGEVLDIDTDSKNSDTEGIQNHTQNRKNKRLKKRRKNTISAMFEGEQVSCLIGRRLGYANKSTTSNEDQYVLNKLFSKAGVSSAFQHESVLSNDSLICNDETPLQRAAKEAAKENIHYVKESRKWCWRPSWDDESE